MVDYRSTRKADLKLESAEQKSRIGRGIAIAESEGPQGVELIFRNFL